MGIEPTSSAWKAEVLAIELHPHYAFSFPTPQDRTAEMVEGGGFEPPKAEPTDLQSAPFDRSGTPPKSGPQFAWRSGDGIRPALPARKSLSGWSPQRDSNPRPADSYPLPLSRPRTAVPGAARRGGTGLGSGLSLHHTGPRSSGAPLQVGGVKSLHSPAHDRETRPEIRRQSSGSVRGSTGLPITEAVRCPVMAPQHLRIRFPRFSHLHFSGFPGKVQKIQISCSSQLSYAGQNENENTLPINELAKEYWFQKTPDRPTGWPAHNRQTKWSAILLKLPHGLQCKFTHFCKRAGPRKGG